MRYLKKLQDIISIYDLIKLYSIIKKNIKILLRSKISALIVILGPILVILLVGFGFNTSSLNNINIASYSPSYSDLSNVMIDQLTKDQFIVTKLDSEEACINSVKTSNSHVCMIIPANLDVNQEKQEPVTFYVDYSRINLVYLILNSISQKISTKSEEISLQLTQSLLDILAKTESDLGSQKTTINSLFSNNAQFQEKAQNIDDIINDINETVGSSFADLENVTTKIEGTNLSEKDKEYVIDSINAMSSELSAKLDIIKEAKQKINVEANSLSSIVETTKSDLNSIESTVNDVTSKIDSLGIRDAARIVSPISTNIQPVTAQKTYLNYTFPTVLILILMFTSIMLSSILIMKEKISEAFFRNFITPTHGFLFILGNYISTLLLVIVQLLIIMSIASFFFSGLFSNFVPIILLIIIASSLFILLGMFLGYLFRSEETVMLGSISIASIFLFFSNTILPIESLPETLKSLANVNPFVVSETLLRRLLLFQTGFSSINKGLIILLAYILIVLILLWMQYNFVKESYRIKRFIVARKELKNKNG